MEKNGAINSQTPTGCCRGGVCRPVRTPKVASVGVTEAVQYPTCDQEAEAMAPRDVLDKAIQQAAGE